MPEISHRATTRLREVYILWKLTLSTTPSPDLTRSLIRSPHASRLLTQTNQVGKFHKLPLATARLSIIKLPGEILHQL